jgi:16S rRNA (uracil1498-N3)-methyltransferase
MNLALLFDEDFVAPDRARLTHRRLEHLHSVLKVAEGDRIPVARVNGKLGEGRIVSLDSESAEIVVELDQEPPPPLPLTLVLAMPRPKMFRRVLQTCASLGVKDLWLIHSRKVEKSYWQTPWLSDEHLTENLTLGLEQSRDSVMPRVQVRKLFKPFVEDELPGLLTDKRGLVAHPGTNTPCPVHLQEPTLLCIGPEGGFIPYEVEKLTAAGCEPVHLGSRILRVETAVPVLISRLFDACG